MPIFLSLMALAIAAPDCPAKIEVKQTLASHLPGWSVGTDDAPHLLAGMTFFDGNPGEKASLAPDSENSHNGKTISLWTFAASARSTWVSCQYAGTDIVLRRELLRSTRACSITYSTNESIAGLPVIEKVECK